MPFIQYWNDVKMMRKWVGRFPIDVMRTKLERLTLIGADVGKDWNVRIWLAVVSDDLDCRRLSKARVFKLYNDYRASVGCLVCHQNVEIVEVTKSCRRWYGVKKDHISFALLRGWLTRNRREDERTFPLGSQFSEIETVQRLVPVLIFIYFPCPLLTISTSLVI